METIRFTSEDLPLDSFNKFFWLPRSTKLVEFYQNDLIPVTVIDLDNSQLLEKSLNDLIDSHPISIDLEWRPDEKKKINPISLFQFCSSKGVLIVLNNQANINSNEILKKFLNSNKFYGKGMCYDQFKLQKMFGQTFPIEDIDISRIKPHELTSTFTDLVEILIGKPMAQFKDKNVSCSDWQMRPLTVQQILYAAFDAYAIRRCWLEFIKLYNEPEVIETPVVVKKKHIGNTKNPSEKSIITIVSSNEKQEITKTKKGKGRVVPQMKKQFKPKILFDVPFGTVNDYLFLIEKYQDETFGFGFEQIEHDMDFVKETGKLPDGYSPHDSLKRRILCLEDVVPIDNNEFFCKLCNTALSKEQIDQHIWMNHCDQIPSYYFPDQSPRYQQLCLQEILVSSLNFKYTSQDKNAHDITTSLNQENENSQHLNCNELSPTLNEQNSQEIDSPGMNQNENNLQTNENGLNEEMNSSQTSENDVECLICHRLFNSFRSFYTHCKLIHAELSERQDPMNIKLVLFIYMTKTRLFNQENHFCSICSKTVDQTESEDQKTNEIAIHHCWHDHGEIIPNLLMHKPINYSDQCFIESFPLGVMSINQLHVGMMFKGTIACGFCKIGFDHPGELFVHLFHRHTKLIAVHSNEIDQWPLKIYDMHIEFQNVLRRLCYENAIETVTNPDLNIFVKVEEEIAPIEITKPEDNTEPSEKLSKSKKKKLLKEKKPEKYIWREKLKKKINPSSYKCQECNTKCFDDDEDAWQHLIHHHIIPVFDYIEVK